MSQWLDEDRELIGPVAMASRKPGDKVCRQSWSCAVGFSSNIAS